MKKRLLIVALTTLWLPGEARTQPPSPAAPPAAAVTPVNPQTIEVEPIRCWWRTTSGAVRVGEPFALVLTCAVLQNEAVQVVPDESRLGWEAIQLAPFEVVSGSRPPDLYSGDRRFFQHEYTLRIINPSVIGTDIRIPDLLISYRVNSTVAQNAALQGRDLTYLMPPQSVRIVSLVPVDAPDIRDTSNQSFARSQELQYRANALRIIGLSTISAGVLLIGLAVIRAIASRKPKQQAGERGLDTSTILRSAAREVAAVQRESDASGWNADLVSRALVAGRLVGAGALGRPIDQRRVQDDEPVEGRLPVRGWLRRKAATVSGTVTPEDMTKALERLPASASPARRQLLEDLQHALTVLTTTQYAREATFDRSVLDEALTRLTTAARRVRSAHAWPKAYFRRLAPWMEARQQA
jgi:hypothetical protein